MPARHQLKAGHGRSQQTVESVRNELAELQPEYPTLRSAIEALRPDIDRAIDEGHHVNKVYELVAKRLKTTPHTVKSALQRAKAKPD